MLYCGGEDITEALCQSQEHGLLRADDWMERAGDIRDYRPLLDRKQKRVFFDELRSSRMEYIDLCHKRRCSVTIHFDPSSNISGTKPPKFISEHDIDRHFGALADIKSIYLPRDLDGSLKGTASLICASPAAAEELLALFKSSQPYDQGSIKEQFLKEAKSWFFKNRRIQDEEILLPDIQNLSVQHWAFCWYHKKQEIKNEMHGIHQKLSSFEMLRSKTRKTMWTYQKKIETLKKKCDLLANSDNPTVHGRNFALFSLGRSILRLAFELKFGVLAEDEVFAPFAPKNLFCKLAEYDSTLKSLNSKIATLKHSAVECDIEYQQKICQKVQIPSQLEVSCNSPSLGTQPRASHPSTGFTELLRHGKRVFVFKCNNAAQARRFRLMLPNYDTPNQTVLWSNVGPVEMFSETAERGSTISLIVRDDVSDSSARQFLQEILGVSMLPAICSSFEMPLRACDANDIQWLDCSDSAVEFHNWKLRAYQFRSIISNRDDWYSRYVKFCNGSVQDDKAAWQYQRFRQPLSQPILDLIFLTEDLLHYRKLKLDIKKIVLDKPAVCIPFNGPMKILLTVVASSVSDNAHLQIEVDENGQMQTMDLEVLPENGAKKFLSENGGCFVEIDQSCLANLLFSDALGSASLKKNFKSFLLNKHGKNFWGKDKALTFTVHKESDRDKLGTKAAYILWNVFKVWSQLGPISICEHHILKDISSIHPQSIPTSDALWLVGRGDTIPMQNVSCCYCRCNFAIPTYVREALAGGPGKFCCISHADFKEKQSKMQTPIFGMTKPDKVIARQSQDPARDKNLTHLFQRICELETLLLLNITVGTQHMLYLSALSSEEGGLQLRMQFQIRRDEYDGDAHLSFYIEGSTELLCGKKQKKCLKKNIEVSVSFCCQTDVPATFDTSLSVFSDSRELEVPLPDKNKLKVQLSGFYGRIGDNGNKPNLAICTENEGCKIPSEWMRRLLEPEYYSLHRAAYPSIQFEVKIPQDHDSSKHAGPSDVSGAPRSSTEANASHLHFSAVAPSYCFEEFWLEDRDCRPGQDEYRTTINALQCFRDTLSAKSELNLSIFSKHQRQQNHIDILDVPEAVSRKIGKDIEHLDAEISKKQLHFIGTVDKLLACIESLPGGKVIQKSFLNLKLLEAFKFFLNSDGLIVKVCVLILFQMIPTRDANVMPC